MASLKLRCTRCSNTFDLVDTRPGHHTTNDDVLDIALDFACECGGDFEVVSGSAAEQRTTTRPVAEVRGQSSG